MKTLFLPLLLLLITGPLAAQSPLHDILQTLPPEMDTLVRQADKYHIQILYTQIDRDARNHPHFRTYTFGDTSQYFYPASTVKMPAAFLALEKLNNLGILGLNRNSPIRIEAGRAPQTAALTDSTAANGLPSIAHYIKKIFLVSDNDAYNRLYEFLGQRYFNEQLHAKGYTRMRITHRLSVSGFDTLGNRYTNPVALLDSAGKMVYFQGEVYSQSPKTDLHLRGEQLGRGYMDGARGLVETPFDFSTRNYAGLRDLHEMLQAVLFPEAVPPQRRFRLSREDEDFLYKAMSMLPRESNYPRYDTSEYYDAYVKFLNPGDSDKTLPPDIRVFNKVGVAYGFLTDVAYIVDFRNQVEFMLSATIHVNADGIFNDNKYEYESIGYPFLAALARAVHQYELKRPVRRKADLRRFVIRYE